jgi:hypothetical protein
MKKIIRILFGAPRNRRGHRLGKWLAFHQQSAIANRKS